LPDRALLLCSNDLAFITGISSALGAIPVLVLAACWFFRPEQSVHDGSVGADQLLALLLTMTVLFSLIQFPLRHQATFGTSLHLSYFWPQLCFPDSPSLLGSFFAQLSRSTCSSLSLSCATHFRGAHKRPDPDDTVLKLPRVGGLKVPRKAADAYMELVPFVRNIAGGDPIFAGPDCPEIYFFTGSRNSTPIIFDSLQDPREYEKEMKLLFERPNFLKVAVTHDTDTIAAYQAYVLRSLAVPRFPRSRKIGSFTVYWRR
jgi:hypothetical protein